MLPPPERRRQIQHERRQFTSSIEVRETPWNNDVTGASEGITVDMERSDPGSVLSTQLRFVATVGPPGPELRGDALTQ